MSSRHDRGSPTKEDPLDLAWKRRREGLWWWCHRGHVWICNLDVESYAAAGRDVEVSRPRCPACRGLVAALTGLLVDLGGKVVRLPADAKRAALEVVFSAWPETTRRGGELGTAGLWAFASRVAGGGWLATTTIVPWAGGAGRPLIASVPLTTP